MGYGTMQINLPKYDIDVRLCVYRTLCEYIDRTKELRSMPHLFIWTILPVTRSTISRWIKMMMNMAGIDGDHFKPHTTRSASVSAATHNGLDCWLV